MTDLDWNGALNKLSSLWRRYSEFELLRTYLEVTYPYIVVPPLPEKKVIYAWQKIASDTFDPDFVDRRRAGLEVRRQIDEISESCWLPKPEIILRFVEVPV